MTESNPFHNHPISNLQPPPRFPATFFHLPTFSEGRVRYLCSAERSPDSSPSVTRAHYYMGDIREKRTERAHVAQRKPASTPPFILPPRGSYSAWSFVRCCEFYTSFGAREAAWLSPQDSYSLFFASISAPVVAGKKGETNQPVPIVSRFASLSTSSSRIPALHFFSFFRIQQSANEAGIGKIRTACRESPLIFPARSDKWITHYRPSFQNTANRYGRSFAQKRRKRRSNIGGRC